MESTCSLIATLTCLSIILSLQLSAKPKSSHPHQMKEMSTILASISSNFFKKSIPLYASISINPLQFHAIPKQKVAMTQYNPQTSLRVAGLAHDPTYVPGDSPPEVPRAPPSHNPGLPPEVPRRHIVPEFDPIPPETPVPPGPNPEFPGPPNPTPPKPAPPEVIPPHGPEITPPKPGPPLPTQPDIPPPIMGSNGLVFY